MHIIPRIEGDLKNPGDWYPELEKKFYNAEIDSNQRQKLSREELLETVRNLKNFISYNKGHS